LTFAGRMIAGLGSVQFREGRLPAAEALTDLTHRHGLKCHSPASLVPEGISALPSRCGFRISSRRAAGASARPRRSYRSRVSAPRTSSPLDGSSYDPRQWIVSFVSPPALASPMPLWARRVPFWQNSVGWAIRNPGRFCLNAWSRRSSDHSRLRMLGALS
jgi:hypothetical protein